MLKRTKGRLLLTLLVITGLAGTLKDNSLSHKERKMAMDMMRDTKADVLKSIKDLSKTQLNFKVASNHWSIKEYTYHVSIAEKNLWDLLEAAMKRPANPEKRAEIRMNDEELINVMEDLNCDPTSHEAFESLTSKPYRSIDEALLDFKARRTEDIKYIKSTTEDLRNHVVQMTFGWVDCYQLCLMMASYSDRSRQQIDEIKSAPNFPKH